VWLNYLHGAIPFRGARSRVFGDSATPFVAWPGSLRAGTFV